MMSHRSKNKHRISQMILYDCSTVVPYPSTLKVLSYESLVENKEEFLVENKESLVENKESLVEKKALVENEKASVENKKLCLHAS